MLWILACRASGTAGVEPGRMDHVCAHSSGCVWLGLAWVAQTRQWLLHDKRKRGSRGATRRGCFFLSANSAQQRWRLPLWTRHTKRTQHQSRTAGALAPNAVSLFRHEFDYCHHLFAPQGLAGPGSCFVAGRTQVQRSQQEEEEDVAAGTKEGAFRGICESPRQIASWHGIFFFSVPC